MICLKGQCHNKIMVHFGAPRTKSFFFPLSWDRNYKRLALFPFLFKKNKSKRRAGTTHTAFRWRQVHGTEQNNTSVEKRTFETS